MGLIKRESFESGVTIQVTKAGDTFNVELTLDPPRPGAVVHWGVENWNAPPEAMWPDGTVPCGGDSADTPVGDNGSRLTWSVKDTKDCPSMMVAVLRMADDTWDNNGGACYSAVLRPPDVSTVQGEVLDKEGNPGNWGLYPRLALVNEKMEALAAAGEDGMTFLLAWLRLSHMKQLEWYRGWNYQSKDMDHMQKTVAERLTYMARSAKDPTVRRLARSCVGLLSRGGGDAEAIRMGILHIMRDFGIKEGHRPGIDEKFLEQWHQKLHQNSNIDDIAIGEAYLAFLSSGGDWDTFTRVLWDVGRLRWEDLAKFSQPITNGPMYLPHLYDAFAGYLWVLKRCHAGADLMVTVDAAQGIIGEDLAWHCRDLNDNRSAWWAPGKAVEIREWLAPVCKGDGCSRDVLLLDHALENTYRAGVEGTDMRQLGRDDLVETLAIALRNAALSLESAEVEDARDAWLRLKDEERWGPDWSLRAAAVAERASLIIADIADSYASNTQRHCEAFAKACSSVQAEYVPTFGEEVARAQAGVFATAANLTALEPMLREAAGLGPWDVVAHTGRPVTGKLLKVAALDSEEAVKACAEANAAGSSLILVVDAVKGSDDIPPGVAAVLTPSSLDLLSHVAIRSRGLGVLLASCADAGALDAAVAAVTGDSADAWVNESGEVSIGSAGSAASGGHGVATGAMASKCDGVEPLRLPQPPQCNEWCVASSEFGSGVVGAKAANVAKLQATMSGTVASTPSGCALPFGAFERCLADPINSGAAAALEKATVEAAGWGDAPGAPADALARCREAVASMQAPAELRAAVAGAAAACGAAENLASDDAAWDAAWSGIKEVWGSKWGELAWLARRQCGTPEDDLRMSVLIQPIAPVAYAFVAHTADPVSGERGVVTAEVVPGMGESLVAAFPGRALRFTTAGDGAEIKSLPAKRTKVVPPAAGAFMVRSDSNGEDLEGFAGAGLYASVMVGGGDSRGETPWRITDEPLVWDGGLRSSITAEIVKVARAVEEAFGGVPQDVEGCVAPDGSVTVVQARPQVL
ncbi:unnamed protein product [Pedinophyceae sp. YPF-701]|nr:unnamed protein product [Pedinophyceae sp. YPF-701]